MKVSGILLVPAPAPATVPEPHECRPALNIIRGACFTLCYIDTMGIKCSQKIRVVA